MQDFFTKHETLITILLIVIYIISNSYCMQNYGMTDYRTAVVNFVLALIIIIFILKNKLGEYYGLTSFPNPKKFLYFIPLLILISSNLWNGISINHSASEIFAHILIMIGVGFLEEIIFRGFLYKMMAKDNIKSAVIVSSLTFGIGHIVNLFNGADIIPTLIQICYATAAGFMFVTIFQKGKSLWPCIITHIGINALSIFNNGSSYITAVLLTIIPILYTVYLRKHINN